MKRTLSIVYFLLLSSLVLAQKTAPVYLFAYFKDNGQDGLHLAYSNDGYQYQSLKGDSSFLKPTAGKDRLMRDPCIIRGADGKFHMVWTVSWNEKSIGYASSEDLIHWSEQQTIPVMEHEPDARNCWAPELLYDSRTKDYMIYWATTIKGKFPETQDKAENAYNHRMYYVTTKDFKTYTPAKLLYEPGFNVIDATIQTDGQQYVMFLKDETRTPPQKNLRVAFSKTSTGPYTKASPPITGNYWAEGPTVAKVDGQWVVYFDKYTEHTYGAVASKDLQTWTDISDKIRFPKGTRHGTVLTISPAELAKLKR
ncbi:glycoside hydrolase family 43 protein [Spirosoma validum]|uniref:Glycoside hydrolase family 43 protein n=1 Tax=Spirosoma validum TaxID=2771355 RepID=A0A927GCS6_9BACT|nr:glycoside hydrolase family 43 protein [Spirosoma validum]MBD2752801.1 glycoside hydrolase family 43 protein [Spirosoma validum]